jgi:hypothetical protein
MSSNRSTSASPSTPTTHRSYIGLSSAISLSVMSDCFDAVHRWFTLNGLSLNPSKSEAIVVGTGARQRREGEIGAVRLGNTDVTTSGSVRSLGVVIDSTMSFDQHVNNVCKASYCHIRALRRIRKILSLDDVKSIATAVVSSRLDYCNALLYGVSATNINKLQRVQNTLARLVVNKSSQSHAVSILADLHWLPVSARIRYKVLLLTYKTLTTQRPRYLHDLLQLRHSVRQLRSSDHSLLQCSRAKTVFGSRAFRHSAPTLWNSLPSAITDDFNSTSLNVLKRKLKTYLFNNSYRI